MNLFQSHNNIKFMGFVYMYCKKSNKWYEFWGSWITFTSPINESQNSTSLITCKWFCHFVGGLLLWKKLKRLTIATLLESLDDFQNLKKFLHHHIWLNFFKLHGRNFGILCKYNSKTQTFATFAITLRLCKIIIGSKGNPSAISWRLSKLEKDSASS